ncbi:MAG: MbnP family copper-binding protein [Nannocystales bacterium]
MKTTSWLFLAALAIPVGCDSGSGDSGDTDDGSSSDGPTAGPSTSGPTTDPSTSTTAPTSTSTTTPTTTADTDTDTEAGSGDSESGADSSSTGVATQDVTLQFAGRINGVDAACDTQFMGVGSALSDAQIRDFRLYVSNIRLVDADGEEVALELEQDGVWQYENVALLDFEDGTGLCADTGNADVNSTVVGTVPEGDYTGVRFDVGVPADLNHTDPNTAEAPLNVLPMTWNWLVGRKFVRFDLLVDNFPADNFGWNTHLGSQGCSNSKKPNPMEPPTEDCTRPQRPAIALDAFDLDTNTIVVDAGALLADVDVSGNVQGAPGCMSFFPADPEMQDNDCADVFPNYGMDWQTGACVDGCSGQTFITVE